MRNGNTNFDIRIDRQSKWGNRHYMNDDSPAERDRVCDEHEKELWEKIHAGDISLSELEELYGKRLGCWCKPKRCHGDALAEAAEWAHRLMVILRRLRRKKNAKRKRIKKQKVL
ncbi:hypothetical protein HOU08_gp060 [Dickeya phage vB_DsoM_JA29]|uniref:DUF4326 domain-containing protein n=1 Tax=Dickeya phage vB_DsoM_JA29 TaxID=2283031 RepID=A0A384ZX22_9CAUD|nr:hypothetical protein HOU08_gp060 [Dickeya phage vB_DsoM_JA29]AXG66786.1 hypothetical protein JA29_060 [Dickeya phage vB_DsoM_JA29]